MKLVHFYHIYADGQWLKPFSQHLNALQQSGLLDALDGTFNVGIVGSEDSYRKVLEHFSEIKAPVKVVTFETDGYEQVTLDAVSDYAKSVDEAYILYAHTKGAANPADGWRETMTHCNVGYWRSCVEALDSGCHLVGCHWFNDTNANTFYFAGNFYWGKASALRLLPKCERTSRYSAETWINELRYLIPDYTIKDLYARPLGNAIDTKTTVPYIEKLWIASINDQ